MSQENGTIHRVLVLDDSKTALQAMRSQLEDFEVQVYTFEDAQNAFDFLSEEGNSCDMLIVDINLPGQQINGFTFASKLATDLEDGTPVIFISGEATEKQRNRIRRMGPSYNFLDKSIFEGTLAGSGKDDILFDRCSALLDKRRFTTDIRAIKKDMKVLTKGFHKLDPEVLVQSVTTAITLNQDHRCKEKHKQIEGKLDQKLNLRLSPSAVIWGWRKQPFAYLLILVLAACGTIAFEWLRFTYNLANQSDKRLDVQQQVLQQIPVQMKVQEIKVDKLIDWIKKKKVGD